MPATTPQSARLTKVEAAVRDLLIDHDQDALDHLVNICCCACRDYVYITEGAIDPLDATREFLRHWLMERLAPYYNGPPEKIEAALAAGTFRHLGRQATNAVIDKLRSRRDALDQHTLSFDMELSEEGDTLVDHLLCAEDAGYVCPLGKWPSVEPEQIDEILANEELKRGMGKGYRTLKAACSVYPDGLKARGAIVRAIKAQLGVSARTARRKLQLLPAQMKMQCHLWAVRFLYSLLNRPGERAWEMA